MRKSRRLAIVAFAAAALVAAAGPAFANPAATFVGPGWSRQAGFLLVVAALEAVVIYPVVRRRWVLCDVLIANLLSYLLGLVLVPLLVAPDSMPSGVALAERPLGDFHWWGIGEYGASAIPAFLVICFSISVVVEVGYLLPRWWTSKKPLTVLAVIAANVLSYLLFRPVLTFSLHFGALVTAFAALAGIEGLLLGWLLRPARLVLLVSVGNALSATVVWIIYRSLGQMDFVAPLVGGYICKLLCYWIVGHGREQRESLLPSLVTVGVSALLATALVPTLIEPPLSQIRESVWLGQSVRTAVTGAVAGKEELRR